jgi:hypothetical protein
VRGLPDQISDQDFWRMVTELSEPSGQYTGDNWISNEPTIQDVIPPLRQLVKPGGAYIGVGPEQNFTYMWALQSKIGFIVDIRRQNMLDLLMFKAFVRDCSGSRGFSVASLLAPPAGRSQYVDKRCRTDGSVSGCAKRRFDGQFRENQKRARSP